jgi:hypothetical protein
MSAYILSKVHSFEGLTDSAPRIYLYPSSSVYYSSATVLHLWCRFPRLFPNLRSSSATRVIHQTAPPKLHHQWFHWNYSRSPLKPKISHFDFYLSAIDLHWFDGGYPSLSYRIFLGEGREENCWIDLRAVSLPKYRFQLGRAGISGSWSMNHSTSWR